MTCADTKMRKSFMPLVWSC